MIFTIPPNTPGIPAAKARIWSQPVIQQLEAPTVSSRMSVALMSAVAFAGEQLSGFMERPIHLRGTHVERLRLERLPDLQADADRGVIAIYLSFSGALE